MKKRGIFSLLAVLIASLALVAAGCGGDDDESSGGSTGGSGASGGSVEALPSSSCTGIEYEGEGNPDALIVSDLPMQGSSRTQTVQMTKAIRYVLEQAEWKAGDLNIGYQVCDDATAQAGKWDSGKCNQNGRAYANNKSVIGVIGTYNSGCALIIIPVLNQAPNGPVGMVSPANTYVCITEGTGCDESEPDKYYPTGKRNYIRVVPYDAYQAAVDAQLSKDLGIKKVYVLNDKEAYGLGVALLYRAAAQKLGIEVAGFSAWAKESASYESIMRRIKATGADGIFLGGLIEENGGQVIKDKVAVLGSNDDVKLIGPDGFAQQATIDDSGVENARGMYVTVAGAPAEKLTGQGKTFVDEYRKFVKLPEGQPADPYAAYAAQAATVMLDAIEKSDGSRGDVAAKLFETKVTSGILGSFDINKNGDVAQPKGGVVNYSIFKLGKVLETYQVAVPDNALVEYARTHVKSG